MGRKITKFAYVSEGPLGWRDQWVGELLCTGIFDYEFGVSGIGDKKRTEIRFYRIQVKQ